jgi:hypothetical protein
MRRFGLGMLMGFSLGMLLAGCYIALMALGILGGR